MNAQYLFLDLGRGRWRVGGLGKPASEFRTRRDALGVRTLYVLASHPGEWLAVSHFTTGGPSAFSNLKSRALAVLGDYCFGLADELADGVEVHRGRARYHPWGQTPIVVGDELSVSGCECSARPLERRYR